MGVERVEWKRRLTESWNKTMTRLNFADRFILKVEKHPAGRVSRRRREEALSREQEGDVCCDVAAATMSVGLSGGGITCGGREEVDRVACTAVPPCSPARSPVGKPHKLRAKVASPNVRRPPTDRNERCCRASSCYQSTPIASRFSSGAAAV